jgi:hypothetical protein
MGLYTLPSSTFAGTKRLVLGSFGLIRELVISANAPYRQICDLQSYCSSTFHLQC